MVGAAAPRVGAGRGGNASAFPTSPLARHPVRDVERRPPRRGGSRPRGLPDTDAFRENGLLFSNGDYTLEIGKRVVIRVDTIENSVIRRSIDIRKTMYNENIDCNYDGIAAIFRAGAHPEVYNPSEFQILFVT